MTHSRSISYDEHKAAEAAFQGRPFNPAWSQAARTVYDGILQAKEHPVAPPIAARPAAPVVPIDLTPIAKTLGAPLPIQMDPALWQQLSTHSDDALRISRARDIVLALLVTRCATGSPSELDFPALLWDASGNPTMHQLSASWHYDGQSHGSLLIRRSGPTPLATR